MDKKHFNKRSWLLIGVILIILITLFLWGWIPRVEHTKKIDALAAIDPLPRVVVMQIKPNTKPIEVILPSSAEAWHITPIWARTNGYLIRYLVDIGDIVKEGDLLAEIDTPEVDQELAEATAQLSHSIALNDIAKITSTRWQQLWDKNREAVSKQEVDQYNSNSIAAEAEVDANKKNVARLTYLQQFKYVYAPFEGIIIKRDIDIGSLIYGNVNNKPQELFQIAQTHTMRFFVQVPQYYFRQIKDGLKAEVTVQEFPDKTFTGVVSRYTKALNPSARTLTTEVDVDNKEGLLYNGLFARVKFIIWPDTTNFIIPTTALIIRSGHPHVATVDKDNTIHLKDVQIGRDYGKEIEIISGLQENDRIVTIPSDAIVEGAKVELIGKNNKDTKKGP